MKKDRESKRRQQIIDELTELNSIGREALSHGCQGVALPMLEVVLQVYRTAISCILNVLGGLSINDTAARYGVTRTTIYNKIRELNLDPPQDLPNPTRVYVKRTTLDALDKHFEKHT